MVKLPDILIELISGGVFFKYPALIPVVIAILTVIFAYLRYKYLWDYQGRRGFDLWRSVIAATEVAASGLLLVGWLFYRYWGLPPSFTDEQIGILVAEVPDQTNREQQVAYQNALRLRVQNNKELREVVKVRLIERPLTADADAQQAEAIKIGRWLRAAFVLRPFVVEGVQEPWLTVVNPENVFQAESSLGKFSSPQVATLDTLPLPEDLTQLAKVALALALSKRHSYKEAAQILADVLKSKHLPEAAGSRWALNLLRGDDLLQFGSSTNAVAEFKEAIRLKPDYVEAHNNLGFALVMQGQFAKAAAEYKEAIRLKPDYVEAHDDLGFALVMQGQFAKAVAEFKEVIRLKPNYTKTHYGLGLTLLAQGQYADAEAELKKAIRLKPDDASAHYGLGIALDAQGQHADAAAEYKEAIRLKPDLARRLPQHGK